MQVARNRYGKQPLETENCPWKRKTTLGNGKKPLETEKAPGNGKEPHGNGKQPSLGRFGTETAPGNLLRDSPDRSGDVVTYRGTSLIRNCHPHRTTIGL